MKKSIIGMSLIVSIFLSGCGVFTDIEVIHERDRIAETTVIKKPFVEVDKFDGTVSVVSSSINWKFYTEDRQIVMKDKKIEMSFTYYKNSHFVFITNFTKEPSRTLDFYIDGEYIKLERNNTPNFYFTRDKYRKNWYSKYTIPFEILEKLSKGKDLKIKQNGETLFYNQYSKQQIVDFYNLVIQNR